MPKRVLGIVIFWVLSFWANAIELSPLSQKPYLGDWPALQAKGVIRVLVSADLGFYYIEGGRPKGIGAELLYHFEKKLKTQTPYLYIQVIPVHRDELISTLQAGYGDIAVANLTITPSRQQLVDFSIPVSKDIKELIITNKAHPPLNNIEQLSGKNIWIRASSSYLESIEKINITLKQKALKPIKTRFIEETLQDYELLEMVNSGHVSATILDSHKAEMWSHVMENIQVHSELPLREGGQIAWALRKNTPQLKKQVNNYLQTAKSGTLLGNVIQSKYIDDTRWLTKALNPQKLEQLQQLSKIFSHYANMYQFDYLMMAAQGFQESGLDQSKISHKGAIGIMQVLPSTAKDPNVDIPNIEQIENNIHAGAKYMRFIKDRYFSDSTINADNQLYFSLAAYNAGPANIRKMRKLAQKNGYNPDVWFKNVEITARLNIGKEPVAYVANISRYYVVYKQLEALKQAKEESNTTAINAVLDINADMIATE